MASEENRFTRALEDLQRLSLEKGIPIAIVGGLAVSQLLTLYTVPVVYLWLDRVRLWVKGLRRPQISANPARQKA